jgi:diadenosine tetraphosphate (Ap4A) HIT family hydrolase
MKKNLIALFVLCVVGTGYYLLQPDKLDPSYCAFCNPKVIDAQKFYEDEHVIALYTHKPVMPGHCLIIPKRHVDRFEGIKKVDRAVAQAYGTSSYLLLQKNGQEAGQTVPHVHFHYMPRKTGDDSVIGFFIQMVIANAKRPLAEAEMKENIEKMKAAL